MSLVFWFLQMFGRRSKQDEEEPLLPNKREALEDYQTLPHLQASPNISQQREWLHIDQAGNIWSINNWKPDFLIDKLLNPGGDGILIFVGLAAPPVSRGF